MAVVVWSGVVCVTSHLAFASYIAAFRLTCKVPVLAPPCRPCAHFVPNCIPAGMCSSCALLLLDLPGRFTYGGMVRVYKHPTACSFS